MRRAIVLVAALAAPVGARPKTPAPLVVPQVAGDIHLDGELDEVAWQSPARTGPFIDAHGDTAAPYSEARLLRDDRFLYLALYAADEDIRTTDEFVVELASPRGRATLHFTAAGKLVPAIAGARTGVDLDGDVDDPSNDDEEWVVEAAVPLAAIPFARDNTVTMTVSRCDVPKDGITRCGGWTGTFARR